MVTHPNFTLYGVSVGQPGKRHAVFVLLRFFYLFSSRLGQVWDVLKQLRPAQPDKLISVTTSSSLETLPGLFDAEKVWSAKCFAQRLPSYTQPLCLGLMLDSSYICGG